MQDNDLGYVLHKKKYRESSLIVTFFTQSHGKITAIVKGYYRKNQKQFSLLESGIPLTLELRLPKSIDGLYAVYKSEIYQNDNHFKCSYIQQMCCYYLSELIYYLYPNRVTDIDLFNAYQKALVDILKSDHHEFHLRIFEIALLRSLGYGIEFESDDEGNRIEVTASYQIEPMSLPKKVYDKDNTMALIFSGDLLNGIFDMDQLKMAKASTAQLQAVKKINKLYINHLLQGRSLESRRLLLEYMKMKS